uniref:Uncharacterized protein n=1 Tax=Tetradesmus obliquus TaxID=3088 RepID=A0A383VW55_TETOB|eukprot:jgi/Sobl393_1/15550/SZX69707.1
MVTFNNTDKCEAMIAFPGNNGEAKGLFNGMTWNTFITTGGTIEWKWYKGTPATGDTGVAAPTLKLTVADPTAQTWVFPYQAANTFVYINMEPVGPTWSMGGRQDTCNGHYSLEWWMQPATQSSPRTLSGGGNAPPPCDYQLKWDSASAPYTFGSSPSTTVAAGFMSRAVILSIHLQQGSSNGNTASFVGWLRIKTGSGAPVAYDYTWQFGA